MKPERVDELVCGWSMMSGTAMSDVALNSRGSLSAINDVHKTAVKALSETAEARARLLGGE